MISLPGIESATERVKNGPFRDFGLLPEGTDDGGTMLKTTLAPDVVPVPSLWKAALELIGLTPRGPGEKVEWWINFTYKTVPCTLASEKFGVRLYVTTDDGEEPARKLTNEITKKIASAVQAVEKLIETEAPNLFGQGHATVVNQHIHLRRAYEYFREKAVSPTPIESVYTDIESDDGQYLGASMTNGPAQMKENAFNDLVAAITAYLSLLEHDLVLCLAFQDFDPATDDLKTLIGSNWGDKYERILGNAEPASSYRARLRQVVERWRNMYAHGGFEKGHTASVYLHVPDIGALPVGLTNVRTSPLFTLFPANSNDIAGVFTLFDEFDTWLRTTLPDAMAWAESGLAVGFDQTFRDEVAEAIKAGELEALICRATELEDRYYNMDF